MTQSGQRELDVAADRAQVAFAQHDGRRLVPERRSYQGSLFFGDHRGGPMTAFGTLRRFAAAQYSVRY